MTLDYKRTKNFTIFMYFLKFFCTSLGALQGSGKSQFVKSVFIRKIRTFNVAHAGEKFLEKKFFIAQSQKMWAQGFKFDFSDENSMFQTPDSEKVEKLYDFLGIFRKLFLSCGVCSSINFIHSSEIYF